MANQEMLVVNMAKQYDLDPETFKRVIKTTCGMGNARDEEFYAFLIIAHEHKLNPLIREIYAFVKQGGGIQPIMAVDGWIKKMNEHPAFNGVEFSEQIDGNGELISVTCTIHRKDRSHPTVVTEYLHENRRDTIPWRQMPARMLRHRALVQCIRVAFNLAGIMDPDEAERYQEMLSQQPPPPHEDLPVSSTGKVRPKPAGAAGPGGAERQQKPSTPSDPPDGKSRKATERSAAPTPPPPKPEPPPVEPETVISLERQDQIMERVNAAGIKPSAFMAFISQEFGVGLDKVTSSQAVRIDQYIKEHAQ